MNDFNTIVTTQYPFPIAYPFSQMERIDLSHQVKLQWLFSSFTNAMKLIGMSLEMDYLLSERDGDAKVYKAISKMRKTSLGHLNELIRETRRFLWRERIEPFMCESLDCYQQIEYKTKADVPGDIVDGKKQPPKPLGLISALINRRNVITHGFQALEDDDAQGMWDFCYPVYIQFLEGIQFLRDYILYRVIEFNGLGDSKVLKLVGTAPKEEINPFDFDEDPEIFFYNSQRDKSQPMFPFLVRQVWENSERLEDRMLLREKVFLFEGDTGNKVVYLSPLNRKALSRKHFQVLRDLLARKKLDINFLSIDNLTTEVLKKAARMASSEYLEKMKEQRVYIPDVYQQRRELDVHFNGFLDSTKGGFFLVGDSGIGKTNLVCNLVANRIAGLTDKDVVLLLGGAFLPEQELLEDEIKRRLRVDALFHQFLESLHGLHEIDGMRFVLIVDAVNEHPNSPELLRQLDELVSLSKDRRWWKVMYTIRDTSLRTIRRQLHQRGTAFDPSPQRYYTVYAEEDTKTKESVEVLLHRLNDEEIKAAYQRYQTHEGTAPQTDFELLSPSVKQLIRHPLLLCMVAQVYNGHEIPRTVLLGKVLYDYCSKKIFDIEKLGPKRQRFINDFVDALWENGLEAMEYDQLTSFPNLNEEVLNYESNSAYVQLLDERILMEYREPQPPGVPQQIWKVGFVYDRMLEYLLSLRISERLRRQAKPTDADAIVELAESAESYKPLAGALLYLLLSKAKEGKMGEIAVALKRSNNELLHHVITELLVTLEELEPVNAQSTDDEVEAKRCGVLVHTLLENPSESSKDVLMEFGERLLNIGGFRRAIWLFEGLITICDEQVEANRVVLLYNKIGRVHYFLGNWDSALHFHQQSLSLAEKLDNKWSLAKSYGSIGDVYRILGKWDAALKYYQRGLSLRKELGDKWELALSYNDIGLVFHSLCDYNTALQYYQQSLTLKEELGNKRGMSYSYNHIGRVYRVWGESDMALQYYQWSLSLREELGDKWGMAYSLNNIGSIYKDKGNYGVALQYYQRSLSLHKKLGDKRGMAYSLNNIGFLYYKDKRDYDTALHYYQQSLAVKEELGDKRGLPISYNNLGKVYYSKGDYDIALQHYQRSLELKEKLRDKRGMAITCKNIGEVYLKKERKQEALVFFEKSLALRHEIGISIPNSLLKTVEVLRR